MCDIFCIQETHATEETIHLWTTEWGGTSVYSNGTSAARGVCILIKKETNIKVVKSKLDTEGRSVWCQLDIDGIILTLCNIYAPNADSPHFFEEKFSALKDYCERLIIIGDFNMVMDLKKDRSKNSKNNNNAATAKIKSMMEEMLVADIWRIRNPDKPRYSWYRRRLNRVSSRLDYALVSEGVCPQVHDTFYTTGIETDHSAFFVGIELEHAERGRGFWKLNVSKLSNIEFIKKINDKITGMKEQYEGVDPIEKWELFKKGIKEEAIKESKRTVAKDKVAISQMSDYINEQEAKFDQLSENDLDLLQSTKDELKEIMDKRTKGILFRSKAKWYMEAE